MATLADILTAIETIFVTERQAATRVNPSRSGMVAGINAALGEMGPITQINEALTVDADIAEYTLPAGVSDLARVQVATASTAPYGWKTNYWWEEQGGSLIFDPGKAPAMDGYLMRIWYTAPHTVVSADADQIAQPINKMRLAWSAALYLAVRASRDNANDARLKEFLTLATGQKAALELKFPIHNLPRDPHLARY